ncbi:E3 ubiquitin/ISG15 ligase TRIM25-like [Rana temporaria]|uniref:E3 ubiquitin/ISG15 ligase TRIM25-like n=1 Tax=Rana temporaria TaxID=8407 RepID=UPI001AAC5DD3|nr:E3 ubiquitin/ISG15 ligase TRIM25-like [Rana temporaria]
MASADPGAELKCSICLKVYTDPVKLTCGHNFCRVCIDGELNAQKGSGSYSCPQCRKRSRRRPTLQRNITLHNMVEAFRSTQPSQEETRILCTYCLHSPLPAVKSCLICEASLCEDHLRVHSKSPEHVFCDPTTSMENRKCSVHKELLKYFCPADSSCICVSCSLAGAHRGHQVETMDEASEKKKKTLRNVLQKLTTEREETDKRVQSLKEHEKKVGKLQEKAAGVAERVTALFRDLRRQLEDLEKKVLSEISGRAERLLLSLSDLIKQLEIMKEELSRKMDHIEELCNVTDPLTLLQESGDLCGPEHGDNGRPQLPHDGGDLDIAGISHTVQAGLSAMMRGINVYLNIREFKDVVLDISRAHNSLNKKPNNQRIVQEISRRGFSSGRCYWDMDVQQPEWWIVGVCYPSMEKGGDRGVIGYNNKSWGLHWYNTWCYVTHDNKKIKLPGIVLGKQVRVYLDYEAGQISFYDLWDHTLHLYTFTATFTEPLHGALALWKGPKTTPSVGLQKN